MQTESLARVLFFYTMEHIMFNDKKLFAAKDVAKYFCIDNSALNSWLRINDDFRNNTDYIIEMGGGKKPRRFFTELGLSVYETIKDKPRNNQYNKLPEKKEFNSLYTRKKESTALQANNINTLSCDPIIAQLESLIEIRAIQLDQERRIQEQEERITRLESLSEIKRIEQITSEQKLLTFPEPKKQAPQRTVRSLVVEYVNAYAHNTGLPHNVVWSKIYKEYSIRTRINLKTRAQSHKLSPLEYVEQNGDIEILYAIAKEIL